MNTSRTRLSLRTGFIFFPAAILAFAAFPAHATGDPLAPLARVDMNLRPDERSIERLLAGPDGHLYGVISHTRQPRGRFFRFDAGTGAVDIVAALPAPLVQPRDQLLEGAALAWTWDESGATGYALDRQGRLVSHTSAGARVIGPVAGKRIREEILQVSRALAWGRDGRLYTAGREGHLFRYDPAEDRLEQLTARLPHVRGRQWWASLDAAVSGPDGLIYGGTHDGYIFSFDPETGVLTNHGKPLRQQRVNGLVFHEGLLLGVGGEPEGLARAFAFDPATGGFTLGGPVPGRGEYAPVSALVSDGRGRVYLGTGGRLGNLYFHGNPDP